MRGRFKSHMQVTPEFRKMGDKGPFFRYTFDNPCPGCHQYRVFLLLHVHTSWLRQYNKTNDGQHLQIGPGFARRWNNPAFLTVSPWRRHSHSPCAW